MKILDPSLEFCVGDLLLPKDERIGFIRFMVAARQMSGIARAIHSLVERASPHDDEARDVLLLHLVGAAKEAADSFRYCDSERMFAPLESGSEACDQFRAELNAVRAASRKGDKASLYDRVLKPYRDTMGFHVKKAAVAETLAKLENERFKAADIDDSEHVVSIPLVRTVMALATWADAETPEAGADHAEEVLDFNMAIQGVAHDFFLILVRISTLRNGAA